MIEPTVDSNEKLRRSVYAILIAIGIGAIIGRILAVDSVDMIGMQNDRIKKQVAQKVDQLAKQGLAGDAMRDAIEQETQRLQRIPGVRRPFLSGNDRSRWCTVRALVEPDMRVEGAPYSIDKVIQQPGWDTIDMVRRIEKGDSPSHLYSSKPPLFPTLMAAEYWAIYRATGMSLGDHPYEVGRFMLITINGGFLLLYFCCLARLIERLGTTDWGRIFVMAAGVFGTYLTTFAVVINNHIVAAAFAALLLDMLVRIVFDSDRRAVTFLLAGFSSAMLASDELPALSLAAAVSLMLLCVAPRRTLLAYAPAALVVVIAFFATNWISVHSLKPAYMHRSEGDNWYDYTYVRNGRTIDSYWKNPGGIDRGETSPWVYAFNVLIGHHGIFSLTPVWILSAWGAMLQLFRRNGLWPRLIAVMITLVTIVCMAFYLWFPSVDKNYGGTASGFRWVFWMAPMWFMMMMPAADSVGRNRAARCIAIALLVVSVLSASYPTWNPWSLPWIMDFMRFEGWRT